jgi:hypothetical protein
MACDESFANLVVMLQWRQKPKACWRRYSTSLGSASALFAPQALADLDVGKLPLSQNSCAGSTVVSTEEYYPIKKKS